MTKEIYVDGVRYVPATEAAPSIDAIARGLLARWWGRGCPDDELQRFTKADSYVRVYVNDDGNGPSLHDVLADIAEEIGASHQPEESP